MNFSNIEIGGELMALYWQGWSEWRQTPTVTPHQEFGIGTTLG